MDNQQPSLNEIKQSLGRRSQTKMAVGNFLGNCLRYSRADYLRKLVRL